MWHLSSPKRIFVIAVLIGVPAVYLDSVTGGEFDALRMTDWDVVISGAVSGTFGTAPPFATGVTAAAFAAVGGFATLAHAVLQTVYRTAVAFVENTPRKTGSRGVVIPPRTAAPKPAPPQVAKHHHRATTRAATGSTTTVPASKPDRQLPNPLRDAQGTTPTRAPNPQSPQSAADQSRAVIAPGQRIVRGLVDKAKEVGGILLQILRYRDSDIDQNASANQPDRVRPAVAFSPNNAASDGDPQLRVSVEERQGATATLADRLRLWYGSYVALEEFNMTSREILNDGEALRVSLDDAALGSIVRSMDGAEMRRMIATLEQALGLDAGEIAGHPNHRKATPLSSPSDADLIENRIVDWRDADTAAITDLTAAEPTGGTPAATEGQRPLEYVDVSVGPRPIDEADPDNLPPDPSMPAPTPADQPTKAAYRPAQSATPGADVRALEPMPAPAPQVQADEEPEEKGEREENPVSRLETSLSAPGQDADEIQDLAASTAIPKWFSRMVKQALMPLAFEAKKCGVEGYATEVSIPHMPGHGMALLLGAQSLDEIDHESVIVAVIFAAAPVGDWKARVELGAEGSNDRFFLENAVGDRVGLGDKRIQSIAETVGRRGGRVQFVLHLVKEYGCVIDREPSDDKQHSILKTALAPFAEITVAQAGELSKGLFERLLGR